jgi:tetratricopeptide (TPR) repeat protein
MMEEVLYQNGNEKVKEGNFEHAVDYYKQALEICRKANGLKLVTAKDNASTDADSFANLELSLKIYANYGFAEWKLRNYSIAIDCFTEIIDFYHQLVDLPESSLQKSFRLLYMKSLIRRCSCYETIQEYDKCEQDLEELQHLNSEAQLTISSMINLFTFRSRIHHLKHQDNQVASQEGKSTWMSHMNQSLRLFFLQSLNIPLFNFSSLLSFSSDNRQYCCYSVQINCKIGLGNELGLFNRSLYCQDHLNQKNLGVVQVSWKDQWLPTSRESPEATIFLSKEPTYNSYSQTVNQNLSAGMENPFSDTVMKASPPLEYDLPTSGKVNKNRCFFLSAKISLIFILLDEPSLLHQYNKTITSE